MNRRDLNELEIGHYYKYCNVVNGCARICSTEERLRFWDVGLLRQGDVFLVIEKNGINPLTKGVIYKILGPTVVGYACFTKYSSDHALVHYAEELDL